MHALGTWLLVCHFNMVLHKNVHSYNIMLLTVTIINMQQLCGGVYSRTYVMSVHFYCIDWFSQHRTRARNIL